VTTGQNTIATWTQPPTTNGWNLTTTDIGTYGTDYGQRAYIALTALGANLPNDALYPSTAASADAGPHTLAFPADQLPPVNAFWSLTAYDEQGFLITNTPGVYSIGHRTPTPVPNADGSLTLHIQYEKPADSVPTANWLPINSTGTFTLMLRLYAPQADQIIPTAIWTPPPLTPATGTSRTGAPGTTAATGPGADGAQSVSP
ncbi:DUF1214 domain-containing protein, partial [Streptomyces clavuligerus]